MIKTNNLISQFNKTKEYIDNANPKLISIWVFVLLLIVSLFSYPQYYLNGDMAEYLNNAIRIVNGDKPYVNFWLLFTPGEVYFPALIYKIFGKNINNVIIFTTIFSCLNSFVIFGLSKKLNFSNSISIFSTFLFFYTSVIFNYIGPCYINLYLTFSLIAIYFLFSFYETNNNRKLLYSGLSIGIASYFRLYEVGAIAISILISFLIFLVINKFSKKEILKNIITFIIGILSIMVMYSTIHYQIFPKMFTEVVFESVKNGTSMNLPYLYGINDYIHQSSLAYENIEGFSTIPFLINKILGLTKICLYFFLPILGLPILLYFIYKIKSNTEIFITSLTLLIWSYISFAKGLGRTDLSHLAPALAPLLMLFVYIFTQIPKSNSKVFSKTFRKTVSFVLIVSLVLFLYPIQGIFKQIYSKNCNVIFYNQVIRCRDKSTTEDTQRLVNLIYKNTNEYDYIFVTNWGAPPLYAISNRLNPTYFDSMNDLIVRPSLEKESRIINSLEKTKTKLIIHGHWGYDGKANQQIQTTCKLLESYIIENYRLIDVFGEYQIYKRKTLF
ncbi:MAG: glycosyltransferase family 39 protein [Candidatus Kapabacteria bacterium]|nr:glycosyltransferase family 39 protein [Candidatus Kapabacteria bacterium]